MQKPMLGEMIDWSDPINQGLVLLLRLNEGIGDHVSDLSLNDNHGTLENFTHPGTKTSGWTPGFRGLTLAFDGTNDYIDCGNSESLNLTDAITISVWIKPSAIMSNNGIISKRQSPNPGSWMVIIFTDSKPYFRIETSGGTFDVQCGTAIISDWHHVVAIYNGSEIKCYLDGVLDAVPVTATGVIDVTGDDVLIGRYWLPANGFNGSIDEVRIYNRALLPSEITRLYMEGMPSKSTTHAYPNYFVFDCATTGAAETFALPLEATGTYDFEVHWGDGAWDIITAHDDAAATHTYASAGTHQIVIDGHIEGWRFNAAGDCAKVRDIKSWGCLQPVTNGYFSGCTGLTVSATDVLDLTATTSLRNIFSGCTSLTSVDVSLWDTSSMINMGNMFYGCSSLTSVDVSSWDISNATDIAYLFYGCSSLTSVDVSSWNTSSATTIQNTFRNCSSLTDPAINNWDITSVTNAIHFMTGAKALSTAVYDATLIAWEGQVEQPNVTASFGTSKYSAGAAATAKAALQANGWTITDGGAA